MKIIKVNFYKIKSFTEKIEIPFDEEISTFGFSGKNGAEKSTILKIIWLIQKSYFIQQISSETEKISYKEELLKYLTNNDSWAEITLKHENLLDTVKISRDSSEEGYKLESTDSFIKSFWDIKNPKEIILYIDASKGFSEKTLKFDELDIDNNERTSLSLQAIFNPDLLFAGIYKQLVKDYVHSRLIPSKPDRLLYFHVASKIFNQLIPNIELKNFSGNYNPKEFVLLGKSITDKNTPLYDVRQFSSGEKALLSTLTFICFSKSISALIIDEPENHFHESLLLKFISTLNEIRFKEGILKYIENLPIQGKILNNEWLKEEYTDQIINQIFYCTHSKPLIYKIFSLGQNFIVNKKIKQISYEKSELHLRELGLSTTYSNILLVEGKSDNAALENLFKGKNVKIKSLDGCSAVIDTFTRLAKIRDHITESKFVFLIDSDNKPQDFFTELKSINSDFYEECFITIDAHEFENLFLEPILFKAAIDKFSIFTGEPSNINLEEINNKLKEIAIKSLNGVYKKQISLSMQHSIERNYSKLIWGNKDFPWDNENAIEINLNTIFKNETLDELKNELIKNSKSILSSYNDDTNIMKRCDGKKVFGEAINHFSSKLGVKGNKLRESIYSSSS